MLIDDDVKMGRVADAAKLIQPLPKIPRMVYEIRVVDIPSTEQTGTKLKGRTRVLS